LETAKDVEKLFIKRIVERRKAEAEKRRGEIHLTDLTSDCLRRVWYEKHDPLPDDAPDLIRMWQGEVMHQMPLLKEHELELEYKGVKTRVDEYEDGVLVEKKFVNFTIESAQSLKGASNSSTSSFNEAPEALGEEGDTEGGGRGLNLSSSPYLAEEGLNTRSNFT
jgi:hypothetical protein